MTDRPPSPEAGAVPGQGSRLGMPRWVKVFVIIAIVLAVVVVVGLLTGQLGPGGPHGPGRHLGGRSDTTPIPNQQNGGNGGIGGPADASAAARTVQVTTLDSMTFEPAAFTVSAGETSRSL